jgi:hypothetical protein
MNLSIRPSACAILLAVLAIMAAPPSTAQSVYKSTLADGRVVYGGKPEKGAAKVESVALRAPMIEVEPQAAEAQRQREKAQGAELDKRLATQRLAREKADAELVPARDAVASAEMALASGREPLPGERIATADGGSRLSEAHFERVTSLEDEVGAAKQRLRKAQQDRNGLD